jgi:DNA excision repair protein ERCC-4
MPRAAKPQPPKPCVVVDSREQTPWHFSDAVDTVRGTLHTGDYSLQGCEIDGICIERKSLDDWVGTLVTAYWRKPNDPPKRFENELRRMQSFSLRAIIVEAPWSAIRDHLYVSQAHPSAVFASTCCIMVDWNVPVLMAEDHYVAGRVAERILRRYFERHTPVSGDVI